MKALAPWNNERGIRNRRGLFYSTGLESRKQLLIAESELNRAQLLGDISVITAKAHTLAAHAKSLGSIAALLALLLTFARGQSATTNAKSTWLQKLVKGAGLVSNLWLLFRARPKI